MKKYLFLVLCIILLALVLCIRGKKTNRIDVVRDTVYVIVPETVKVAFTPKQPVQSEVRKKLKVKIEQENKLQTEKVGYVQEDTGQIEGGIYEVRKQQEKLRVKFRSKHSEGESFYMINPQSNFVLQYVNDKVVLLVDSERQIQTKPSFFDYVSVEGYISLSRDRLFASSYTGLRISKYFEPGVIFEYAGSPAFYPSIRFILPSSKFQIQTTLRFENKRVQQIDIFGIKF